MEQKSIHVSQERLKPLVYENRIFKSSDDFSLTKRDFDVAYEELHETEDVRTSALKDLKEKINCDKIVRYRTDDIFLLRYLRYSKFDVEKAYKVLRKFYISRDKYPHVFSLTHVEQILNSRFITYLPYADEDGCIIFWLDYRNWNIDQWSLWDIISAFHILSDMITVNPNVQIHGVKGIWDLRGFSLRHIAHICTRSSVIFAATTLQEMYPWKLKKIVLIHSSSVILTSYNTLRYLLKKKIRDRLVFLGSDINELHKHYQPALLPKEYGGNIEIQECYRTQHIMDNMNYVKFDRSFGPV